jgi:hypothetical protein
VCSLAVHCGLRAGDRTCMMSVNMPFVYLCADMNGVMCCGEYQLSPWSLSQPNLPAVCQQPHAEHPVMAVWLAKSNPPARLSE